jgi:hypothetical protein
MANEDFTPFTREQLENVLGVIVLKCHAIKKIYYESDEASELAGVIADTVSQIGFIADECVHPSRRMITPTRNWLMPEVCKK